MFHTLINLRCKAKAHLYHQYTHGLHHKELQGFSYFHVRDTIYLDISKLHSASSFPVFFYNLLQSRPRLHRTMDADRNGGFDDSNVQLRLFCSGICNLHEYRPCNQRIYSSMILDILQDQQLHNLCRYLRSIVDDHKFQNVNKNVCFHT